MQEILQRDYTDWGELSWLFLVLSAIIFARYLLLSELYQRLIYDRWQRVKAARIVSPKYPSSQQRKEIIWSGISSVLFAVIGVLMIMAWQAEWTQIYVEVATMPLWYLPISFILAMLIHETYYYWLHRWMHRSGPIYRLIHKVHHDSVSTSVWTAFSFHPIESVLQAIIIPVILFVVPMHWVVMVIWLMMMTLSAMINHAGVEIFPAAWRTHWLMKWFIGSSHHDIHHRRFVKNFGLYFTFWDVWMGTESDELEGRWLKINS